MIKTEDTYNAVYSMRISHDQSKRMKLRPRQQIYSDG